MAKKIDSEALKKNGFWIGLGVFGLLWLVALIVVLLSGDAKARTDYETQKKAVDGARNSKPKTVAYQEPWKQHGTKFSAHKDKIWGAAWEDQKGMYTWPANMPFEPLYPDDNWPDDANDRDRFRDNLYLTQFAGLDLAVAPVELAGGLAAVVPPQRWTRGRAPTREEIWLAQEDFWVRRELLAVVREAVNSVAYFVPVPADPKEKPLEGVAVRRVFRNPNWQLDLRFVKGEGNRLRLSDKSLIKNISVSRRTLARANPGNKGPLVFRLVQGRATYPLEIFGEPLPFDKEDTFPVERPETGALDASKEFGMLQALEWEVAPVRRIEAIEVPHHSHRTVTAGLQIRPTLKEIDKDLNEPAADPNAAGGAQGSGMLGGGMLGGGGSQGPAPGSGSAGPAPSMGGGGKMGEGKEAAAGDLTPINKLNRTRYMHVKEQARHLPLAVRLIVEQSHIHDVLTAFANSRLRIQVTQVSVHHIRNAPRGSDADPKAGGPDTPKIPMGGGAGGGSLGPAPPAFGGPMGAGGDSQPFIPPGSGSGGMKGPPTPGKGGPGPMGVGGGKDDGRGGPGSTESGGPVIQDTARLVEMTVYGIATLYERFPPKQPKADAARRAGDEVIPSEPSPQS